MYYAAPWYFTKSDDADGHFTSDATSFSYTYALAYLIMSDCKVINMSLSKNAVDSNGEKIYAENSSEYQEYLKYFESFFNKIRKTGKDFLIVKSAANNNVDSRNDIIGTVLKNIDFSKERTIIVGAARRPRTLQFEKAIKDGGIFNFVWRKEYYSNYGELVDIFAPGDVYSSIYCNKYKWITGTSQATPIVSGVASMVWEINPNLTAKQVKEIILTSTDKSLSYDGKTYGIVNAELSVENAKDTFGSSRVDIKRDYGVIMGKLESPQDIEIDEALIIFTDLENDAKKYISEIEFYDYELVLPFGKYKINLYINGDEYNIKENSEIEISSNSVIPYDITICDNDENVNNSDNEHTYKVYMESVTWEEAKARCEEMGGHLATITSEEEQKYIESINTARVWIGGYKDDDNNWKWVTGEEWNYTNWGDGEPNNSSNVVANERYVAVWSSKWNDLANTNKSEQKGFICEWEAKQ